MSQAPSTLITGASGGIGAALAWQAAADGHHLILAARNFDKLTELALALTDRYGVRVLTLETDLSRPEAAVELVNAVLASGWKVDHLVNNAGFGYCGPLAEMPPSRLTDLFQLNVVSLASLTRELLPAMIARGQGGVLNVASLAAYQPGPFMAVYYASKSCVLSFTEALAEELRGTGVKACCLCPGPSETGFAREASMESAPLFKLGSQTAEVVAKAGWRGYRRGKRVIIPGWKNKLLSVVERFSPHAVSLRVTRKLHGF